MKRLNLSYNYTHVTMNNYGDTFIKIGIWALNKQSNTTIIKEKN